MTGAVLSCIGGSRRVGLFDMIGWNNYESVAAVGGGNEEMVDCRHGVDRAALVVAVGVGVVASVC
jgi:hypothetical protein